MPQYKVDRFEYGLEDVPGDIVILPGKTEKLLKTGLPERFEFATHFNENFVEENRGKTLTLPMNSGRWSALRRYGCEQLAAFIMLLPDTHAVAKGDYTPLPHRAQGGNLTAWALWAL